MPLALSKFSQLSTPMVYNSTIASWDDNTVLTAVGNPNLLTLYFSRVDFPNGGLPPGLLSPGFPQTVTELDLGKTKLRALPDDLDSKWPGHLSKLYLELGEFTEVLPDMLHLKPRILSLHGNPIRELPPELFEMEHRTMCLGLRR